MTVSNSPMPDVGDPSHGVTSLDAFVLELRELRVASGSVSYGEIARRIAVRRREAGIPDALCVAPRTTIYDVFRLGRRRIDVNLVGEIVSVLGVPDEELPSWQERASRAMIDQLAPVDAGAAPDSEPGNGDAPSQLAASQAMRLTTQDAAAPLRIPLLLAILIAVISVTINVLGHTWSHPFRTPLFLDMIGTAFAAFALGPVGGAIVGLASSLFGSIADPPQLPFALVQIAGGLAWGLGFRYWCQRGNPWQRLIVLNLVVAAVSSLIAVPIFLRTMPGGTGHMAEDLAIVFFRHGAGEIEALFKANFLAQVLDKMVAGLLAYAGLRLVQQRVLRRPVQGSTD